MDGLREQAVARVDEEDKEQRRDQQGAELADGADLRRLSVFVCFHLCTSGHHRQCDGSWLAASRHCDSTRTTVQCCSSWKKQLWHQLTASFPHTVHPRMIDTLYFHPDRMSSYSRIRTKQIFSVAEASDVCSMQCPINHKSVCDIQITQLLSLRAEHCVIVQS